MLLGAEADSTTEVALQIQLPIIEGVRVEDLIKIRLDEKEAFERFRTALRQAITERIKQNPPLSKDKIAADIQQDVIGPAVRKIRDRLAASERTLARKTSMGVGIGSLVTICGAYAGLPSLGAVGVSAAAMTTAQAAAEHIRTKSEVALEDMYFCWRATHAKH